MGDDRHHGLAGDVAAEHDEVGLVKGSRVEKLSPADLGTVDIGGKEDPHVATCAFVRRLSIGLASGITGRQDAQRPNGALGGSTGALVNGRLLRAARTSGPGRRRWPAASTSCPWARTAPA